MWYRNVSGSIAGMMICLILLFSTTPHWMNYGTSTTWMSLKSLFTCVAELTYSTWACERQSVTGWYSVNSLQPTLSDVSFFDSTAGRRPDASVWASMSAKTLFVTEASLNYTHEHTPSLTQQCSGPQWPNDHCCLLVHHSELPNPDSEARKP